LLCSSKEDHYTNSKSLFCFIASNFERTLGIFFDFLRGKINCFGVCGYILVKDPKDIDGNWLGNDS
jgi:hypothetical protein